MMKLKIFLLSFSLLILTTAFSFRTLAQSQISFSQYMNNELRINPAFAGNFNALSFAVAARTQWVGISDSPTIYSFTAHTPINKNTAVGVSIANSNFGVISDFIGSGQFAYSIKYSNQRRLSFGVNAGVGYLGFNYNVIEDIKDKNDPVIGNVNMNVGFVAGGGVYYTTPKFEAGISSPELFRPALINTVQIPNDIYIYSKYKYLLGYNWLAVPSIFIQHNAIQKELFYNIDIGIAYNQVVYFSVGTRSLQELSLMSRLRLAEQIIFGYSLDLPFSSNEKTINGLSHEMMLSYIVLLKNYNSTWDEVYF